VDSEIPLHGITEKSPNTTMILYDLGNTLLSILIGIQVRHNQDLMLLMFHNASFDEFGSDVHTSKEFAKCKHCGIVKGISAK
jgi:hypothetical protein